MMSTLIKKMSKMKSFRSRTPASREQIEFAEKSLGLSFANDYKEYLAEFGCASIYGHEFTGICKTDRLNVVSVTIEQKNIYDEMPSDWYVIEESNIDGMVIWQNTKGEVFLKTPNASPRIIANSFSDYLDI